MRAGVHEHGVGPGERQEADLAVLGVPLDQAQDLDPRTSRMK